MSTVELAWRARRGDALGLTGTAGLGLDWGAVIARKNRLVPSWSEGTPASLERKGIAVPRGRARFVGSHEFEIDGTQVTAQRVVIATGRPRPAHPFRGSSRP